MGRRNEKGRAQARRRLPARWANVGAFAEGAAVALGARPEDEIFVRGCGVCGHVTAALDELLIKRRMECPRCGHTWSAREAPSGARSTLG
jgi:hypothetical protein